MLRRNRFADLHRRLVACPARLIENAIHRFTHTEGMLRVLGPDATLRRGYSITMNERGQIIVRLWATARAAILHPNDALHRGQHRSGRQSLVH